MAGVGAGAGGRGAGNGAGSRSHRNRFERRAEIPPLLLCSHALIGTWCIYSRKSEICSKTERRINRHAVHCTQYTLTLVSGEHEYLWRVGHVCSIRHSAQEASCLLPHSMPILDWVQLTSTWWSTTQQWMQQEMYSINKHDAHFIYAPSHFCLDTMHLQLPYPFCITSASATVKWNQSSTNQTFLASVHMTTGVCHQCNTKTKCPTTANKSSAVAEMGDHGHSRHGPKGRGLLCPFRGSWDPV